MWHNPIRVILDQRDGGKLTQLISVFAATLTLFCTGLYQGWGAPSLSKIMSDEYPPEVTQDDCSNIIMIGQVGHVIGGFLASYFSDFIGRKYTILLVAIPQVTCWTLVYISYYHVAILYVARVFGGISDGAAITVVPTYIAEVAEPEIRGSLGIFITLNIVMGILFINSVGSFLTIHSTALICLTFSILFIVTFSNMPESPYYLLKKQKYEEAKVALEILRRSDNVEKELMQLQEEVIRQTSETGTFKDLFIIKANRKALTMATLARVFQLCTGIVVFHSYNQLLVSQSTKMSPVLGVTFILFAQIAGVAVTSLYIKKFGRKIILATSAFLASLCLYSQAIFLTLKDFTSVDVTYLNWLPVLIMICFNLSFCGGLGTLTNIYIGEIYSTSIKAKGLSIASIVFATLNIVTTKFYQYTSDHIASIVPFYTFATSTLLSTLFFCFVLPETKGKTLEEIQQKLSTKN